MACLRVHGMEPKYHHKYLGWNGRLDAMQAASLRVKLPHLDGRLEARQAAAKRYDALIEEHHLGHFLRRPTIRHSAGTPSINTWCRMAKGERDALVQWLKAERDRLRDLLSRTSAFAGMLVAPRPSDRRLPGQRRGVWLRSGVADVPELTVERQRRIIGSSPAFLVSAVGWPRERPSKISPLSGTRLERGLWYG